MSSRANRSDLNLRIYRSPHQRALREDMTMFIGSYFYATYKRFRTLLNVYIAA